MANSSRKNVIRLLDEIQESLPPEQGFLEDLKRSIELSDKKNKRKPSMMYKPSSLQCIRNMYYQRSGKETDEEGSSYTLVGICNSGSDIHIRIQTAISEMKENGMDCEYVDVAKFVKQRELENIEIVSQQGMETKLRDNKYHLSFMCDGIIKYKSHYYILEIKTETVNKWFTRKGINASHIEQATAYSIALGINEVIFVYISRDTLDMKSFLFKPDGDTKQALIGKLVDCEGYVEKGIVPPKIEDDKKVCQYCSYRESCKRDG